MSEWTIDGVYLFSVAKTFRKKFQGIARNSDLRLGSAGYEHIPVDFHVPILDIQVPLLIVFYPMLSYKVRSRWTGEIMQGYSLNSTRLFTVRLPI